MIVNVPTKVIPVWFIEQRARENAEPNFALDVFIKEMINAWNLEEVIQLK